MAGFDFIDAAAQGYRFLWAKRVRILNLALLPLGLKLGSFALIVYLGLETNFLRQGLILIPASFAEGWLVALLLREAVLKEQADHLSDLSKATNAYRYVIASTIIYVLTKMVMSVFAGLAMAHGVEQGVNTPEPVPGAFIGALLFLAGAIWAFRLLWLYIPVALGQPVRHFLHQIRGYSASFYMMAVWLLCFFPLGIVMMGISEILANFLGIQEGDAMSHFPIIGLQAIFETVITIASSVAMAYGLCARKQEDE